VVVAALSLGAAGPTLGSAMIGVNFVGGGGGNANGASIPATTVAGLVPQNNFNNFTTASGSDVLNLSDGSASGASINWNSNNTWATGALPGSPTGDQLLMNGYLDDSPTGNAIDVSISGLPTSIAGDGTAPYNVILYIAGDTAGRGGGVTVSTASNTLTGTFTDSGSFNGTYVQATDGPGTQGNYVLFTGVTGTDFSINLTPSIGGTPRIPLDGLQIVAGPLPEPSSMACILGIGLVVMCRRRAVTSQAPLK
jgi:hypothetical protein